MNLFKICKVIYKLTLVALFVITCTQAFAQDETKKKESQSSVEYTIDGKKVSRTQFDKFLKGLEEIKGTWFCDETTEGGNTGYDAKDKQGTVYQYRAESEKHSSKNFIHKKPELK